MNKYAQVAIIADNYIKKGMSPRDAWEKASSEIFPVGSSSQKKGCPRNAFLGLYDESLDSLNAQYARKAIKYLKLNQNENITEKELWAIVLDGQTKAYNSQMHVVLALYRGGRT